MYKIASVDHIIYNNSAFQVCIYKVVQSLIYVSNRHKKNTNMKQKKVTENHDWLGLWS